MDCASVAAGTVGWDTEEMLGPAEERSRSRKMHVHTEAYRSNLNSKLQHTVGGKDTDRVGSLYEHGSTEKEEWRKGNFY